MLRTFEPAQQVAGRVELATGGVLKRGRTAGVDVMGDGAFVPFTGGMRREQLKMGDDSPWTVVRRALH